MNVRKAWMRTTVLLGIAGCGHSPHGVPDANGPTDDGMRDIDARPSDAPTDTVITPGVPERVSPGQGGMTAITLAADGTPSIAYSEFLPTPLTYAIAVSTRNATGWSYEPITNVAGGVSDIGHGFDPAGHRGIGYVHLGASNTYRAWATTDATGSWVQQPLGDMGPQSAAILGDIEIATTGDVHIILPNTQGVAFASSVRHLAVVGGNLVDETLAPRLPGSQFGLGVSARSVAVLPDATLSLFTLDDASGPTEAYVSVHETPMTIAQQVATLPDLGSSGSEVWGAALLRSTVGRIAVSSSSTGNGPVHYQVFREGTAGWTTQSIGPLGYAAASWCAAGFGDGAVALFVYDEVGSATDFVIRLLLIEANGTYTDQVIDTDVMSGGFCSAVTDATSIHLAYRKADIDGVYYQRILR
jgi:hypothetical protein